MALQMSQEYSGTLAKFEYSRYENNVYLNNIHNDFLNYISDAIYKEKDISDIEMNFTKFIFKDRYNIFHLDSTYKNKLHITFRGINNELLNLDIFKHKNLLLYITLMEQGEFYRFIFKYTLETNSIILIKNIDIMEDIFTYQEQILSKQINIIEHLHLDDFEIINMYQEKEYSEYEQITVLDNTLFNNFYYYYDLSKSQYILNRLFKSSLNIFISITRKRLNIFQFNLLIEREYYIPLLITVRIDMRKKIPTMLKGRSILYNINDYKKLSDILPEIGNVLRYKLRKIGK